MTTLKSWPRSHYAPGGGDATLFFKVHGTFTGEPHISCSRHRTSGVPDGCRLESHEKGSEAFAFGLDGLPGDTLKRSDPQLFARTREAEQCLTLRGDIADPQTLDYLRDAVGLITALLEHGGVSVFDPYRLSWWSSEDWKRDLFEPDGAVPRHHVVILKSADWYHTRGMLKFGRPDLSVRDVPAKLEAAVIDLLNRFIEMLAFGAVVPEGQPIKLKALPDGWVCRHQGSIDDPEFNNRHIEIGPR